MGVGRRGVETAVDGRDFRHWEGTKCNNDEKLIEGPP